MASKIEEFLNKILSSRYGKDVRQAIHDGIHQCYEDGKAGATDLIAREQIANLVANNNPTAGNSELLDIRVSYDGKTYESAGESVREQFNMSFTERGLDEKTDFNDYIQNGSYLINKSSMLNHPLSNNMNGSLNVFNWNKDNIYGCVQIFVASILTSGVFLRIRWNNTWTQWTQLATSKDILALNEIAFTERNVLDSNCNFDDYIQMGSYLANGSNYINNPFEEKNGLLNVFTHNHEHIYGKVQLFVSSNNNVYIRIMWNNIWTQWIRIVDSDDLNSILEELSNINEKMLNTCGKFVENFFVLYKDTPNIINPDSFIEGEYYDSSSGEIVKYHTGLRTPLIEIPDDVSSVYLYMTEAITDKTGHYWVCFFDEIDGIISYISTNVGDPSLSGPIPPYTKKIGISINTNQKLSKSEYSRLYGNFNMNPKYEKFSYDNYVLKNTHLASNKRTENKIFLNFGDSIFGIRRPPNDISTYLSKLTGFTVYNVGFGGCQMSEYSPNNNNWNAFSMYSLADSIASSDWSVQDSVNIDSVSGMPSYFKEALNILKETDFSKVYGISISYGTNDFGSGDKIDNAENPKDVTTYGGALRYSLEKILNAYPNIMIYICSPIYRSWDEDNGFEDSDTKTINGNKLTDFVEKTKNIANEYHLPYIDNYYSLGFNKYNREMYFPVDEFGKITDGTHPTSRGMEEIAKNMAKIIR